MVNRVLNILENRSFFLLGARGVGKTTFLEATFSNKRILKFDLLEPELEDEFTLNPSRFKEKILEAKGSLDWVLVDEVQKCPKLLNSVHQLIEKNGIKFALTGSSARRLKQKGTNLLAGRALMNYLFPFTHREIDTPVSQILEWGSLPPLYSIKDDAERTAFLRSYALTYVKAEVQAEQWVRKLEPFRRFLGIAAQMNGKIINYSNIARDVGVDVTTVQNYYEILTDTLLGFELPAYHRSLRKQQRQSPKYFLFDLGVKRALDRTLDIALRQETSAYGEAFEHLVIVELMRLKTYFKPDWEMHYLQTKEGAEIDLIIDRPGEPVAFIEIKSKSRVDERDTRTLEDFLKTDPQAQAFLFSQDPISRKIGNVSAHEWKRGIVELGL